MLLILSKKFSFFTLIYLFYMFRAQWMLVESAKAAVTAAILKISIYRYPLHIFEFIIFSSNYSKNIDQTLTDGT